MKTKSSPMSSHSRRALLRRMAQMSAGLLFAPLATISLRARGEEPVSASAASSPPAPSSELAKPPSARELVEILRTIDARQSNQGDWRSLAFMEQKQRDRVDTVYEMLVFRRSEDEKFMFLFTKPKVSRGQGYLRIDKNLWFYDPTVGKWERRTERERIGGTNSRRSDFDESRLAAEYTPRYLGEAKLGAYQTLRLELTGKKGVDVAFPVVKLWVDRQTLNVLKRQEFALSGRLLRTSYYPKWRKIYSESKQAEVWYPQEIRFYDEVDKANSTLIINKSVDLSPLPPNMFTKAWLESKTR